MFARTDSGLYRPRTIEEDRELEMHVLNAPLIEADYVSSISQVLSPRRGKELIDLAKIIRDTAEPHVGTTIPNDMRVRGYRDADYHPHIQAGLKVELMYSYLLLHAAEQDNRKRAEYLQEAQRLEREINDNIDKKNLFIHAIVIYEMRSATTFYFRAAWNFINNGEPSATKTNLNIALQYYDRMKKYLVFMQSDASRKIAENIGTYGIRGISKIAQLCADNSNKFAEAGLKVEKEGFDELFTMLISDQFEGLMQDVLFGEMRCYALQGDNKKFKKSSRELADYIENPKNKPAPVITKSCAVMMDDAIKNLRWKGLRLNPFVSDSPPIVLEAIEDIKESFGKVSLKLWKPGDKLKPIVLLP